MGQVYLLLSVVLVGCLVSQVSGSDNQRHFSMAVNIVQNLHLIAQKMFNDFVRQPYPSSTTSEGNLSSEQRRQLNKIFHEDFCNSDYISPVDKHETQRSSMLKLLYISVRLVESWDYPSQALSSTLPHGRSDARLDIRQKLSNLKMGIDTLIRETQDSLSSLEDNEALQLPPYGNYYQNLGADGNVLGTQEQRLRNYELLACFKKDMHKVETYLTVAKCRRSLEANCTL